MWNKKSQPSGILRSYFLQEAKVSHLEQWCPLGTRDPGLGSRLSGLTHDAVTSQMCDSGRATFLTAASISFFLKISPLSNYIYSVVITLKFAYLWASALKTRSTFSGIKLFFPLYLYCWMCYRCPLLPASIPSSLHPLPAPLLSVSMGCARMHTSPLVNLFLKVFIT